MKMKKLSIFTTVLFTCGLYLVPAAFATSATTTESKDKQIGQSEYQKDQKKPYQAKQGQQTKQGQKFQQQKQNLVLVENLKGAEIQNQQGENVGEIDTVLVDVKTGQVAFVTLGIGGILGVGEERYVVPFNALQNVTSQATEGALGMSQMRFTLNKSKNELKRVPEGDIQEALSQESETRGIFEHYGVSPYWEDNQRQQNRQDETQRQMMQDMKKDQTMDKKDQQKNQKK